MTENIYIYMFFKNILLFQIYFIFFSRETKNKKNVKKNKKNKIWPNLAKSGQLFWPDLARFGQISFFLNFVEKKIKTIPGRNPDGKKSGHLQFFFWWKLSRWKKNLEDLWIFFSLQKEMEKEMKILMGKIVDIFNFFLVEIIQVEKKPGRSKDFFP